MYHLAVYVHELFIGGIHVQILVDNGMVEPIRLHEHIPESSGHCNEHVGDFVHHFAGQVWHILCILHRLL